MKNLYLTVLLFVSIFSSKTILAQTPIYNSYPSAQAVILLDFDGHYVTGTSWNFNGPIDAASANLTNAQIEEVFNRVAEDYRPFNINVTTDEAKYLAAPIKKRMRVILTTSHSWYGNTAGGVAFMNTFVSGDNTPCFVFTALFNYNTKFISEAASHEAGHTLGLTHQAAYNESCSKISEYNSGTGSGETAWAPIMGVGYYRNFTVWHNGQKPTGCANTQNDLAIITNTTNGFGYRTDDHGSAFRDATTATFSSNKFNVSGVVSQTDDLDYFKFTLAETGTFKLDGVPYNIGTGNVGSNLDMQLDLYDGKQNLIGSYNPGTALNSIIDTMLFAGTYYFKVDGQGNTYATEYGSLGSYSLQGTFGNFVVLPVQKLELKGLAENGKHKLSWQLEADQQVARQTLEVSDNGRHFRTVTDAADDVRSYEYTPATSAVLQYRLNITLNNGRQTYSNVVAIRSGNAVKPHLFNTLVRGNALMVSAPAVYRYSIIDFNGRQIMNGMLAQGSSTLNISQLSRGAYVLRFTNGEEQYLEKFVKQ